MSAIPDAWDDDWETLADKHEVDNAGSESTVKLSRAERKAKHEEANMRLWAAAETSGQQPLFLQTRDSVLLPSEWKPSVKVLSRKPPPKVVVQADAPSAMANMTLEEDDSEEEERTKAEQEFAERQARAQSEREEKQRKYQEARQRLFGPTNASFLENSAPANTAPVSGRNSSRGKGRGRAERDSPVGSPARRANPKKQLYDPNYTAKPNSIHIRKQDAPGSSELSSAGEEQPIRAPRGPDGSGRGGFGFAARGHRSEAAS